jgi:hypothetical protein
LLAPLIALICSCRTPTVEWPGHKALEFSGVLISPAGISAKRLRAFRAEGYRAVALELDEASLAAAQRAVQSIQNTGLDLWYWIEIARNPRLADQHPAWMASLQGHEAWRRVHPRAPRLGPEFCMKNYPWVPISYQPAFAAHLDRVKCLLARLPRPRGLLLNDLQSGPSACGCGHPLCRWTSDYGPQVTAQRLGPEAAAGFVQAVQQLVPGTRVVPVWATECEQQDQHGLCGGVGCYDGLCWKEWTRQLMPLARQTDRIGVLSLVQTFDRELPRYGTHAAWIRHAVASFAQMPPQRGGEPIPARRLIPVLEASGRAAAEIRAQIQHCLQLETAGYLVALVPIDQSWRPRPFRLPPRQ